MSLMHGPHDHARLSRRAAVQAGAIGLLGLGMNHLEPLRAASVDRSAPRAKSVIYIFLSGGLAQQDSFDLKPDAPDTIRGEFKPIATATPGTLVCEHLPMLAARSKHWSLVRSLTHPFNEHSEGHLVMLTGRSVMPVGFDANRPRSTDWPSIAAVAGAVTTPRNNLPPAVVLPEKLIHNTGRVIPGQFAGLMGDRRDPWFVLASPYNPKTYGAYPEFGFHHNHGAANPKTQVFQAPNLQVPVGLTASRLGQRMDLIKRVDQQRADLEHTAETEGFDRYRQQAISLLTDPNTQRAFDVTRAPDNVQQRYGRNAFGWSLLMAKQLVAAGVNLVQVNLGNNETWDTHESAFPNLKQFLLPPMDRAVSALLDDLAESGLLDSTMVVMAGEFGRTPKVFCIPNTNLPGRGHWGAVQTVFLAGGGIPGGTVLGSSDKQGGYPAAQPQKPENLAATIYRGLGIPATASWADDAGRPHQVYSGEPLPL